jgi:hypothetical protein
VKPQARGSSRAKAAITARSAQSGLGRAIWRRKTATSCRSTRISVSLAGVASGEEREPAEQLDHERVDEADEHDRRA